MTDDQTPVGQAKITTPAPPKQQGASSQAITALVLGIIGLICCQPLGIAAWIIGKKEKDAITRGESPQEGMGIATAAWILGIVDTVLFILLMLGAIVYFILIFLVIGASSTNTINF